MGNLNFKCSSTKAVTEAVARTPENKQKEVKLAKNDAPLVIMSMEAYFYLYITNIKFLISIGFIEPISAIILQYAYIETAMNRDLIIFPLTNLKHPYAFFNQQDVSSTAAGNYLAAYKLAKEYILTAGPLDKLASAVRKNPDVLLPTIQIEVTLFNIGFILRGNLLQIALILLDNTMKYQLSNASMNDKGQAEMLMDLTRELLPERVSLMLKQARLATFHAEEKIENEEEVKKVLKAAFAAIKSDVKAACAIIVDHIKNTKPAVITTSRYFLDLVRFVAMAFNIGRTRISGEQQIDNKQLYQYCGATAGSIQDILPVKPRRILDSGLRRFLYQSKNINRNGNLASLPFLQYYDDVHLARDDDLRLTESYVAFKELASAILTSQQALCENQAHTPLDVIGKPYNVNTGIPHQTLPKLTVNHNERFAECQKPDVVSTSQLPNCSVFATQKSAPSVVSETPDNAAHGGRIIYFV